MRREIAYEDNCKIKNSYELLITAKSVSERIKRKSKKRVKLYPYQCNVCNKYHLTKRSPKDILYMNSMIDDRQKYLDYKYLEEKIKIVLHWANVKRYQDVKSQLS